MPKSPKQKNNRNPSNLVVAAKLIGLGWIVAVPAVGGALLGLLFDRLWGWGTIAIVVLVLTGLLAGLAAAYKTFRLFF